MRQRGHEKNKPARTEAAFRRCMHEHRDTGRADMAAVCARIADLPDADWTLAHEKETSFAHENLQNR
eukprot:11226631-Lingulodinium_polyedra.AAC.1